MADQMDVHPAQPTPDPAQNETKAAASDTKQAAEYCSDSNTAQLTSHDEESAPISSSQLHSKCGEGPSETNGEEGVANHSAPDASALVSKIKSWKNFKIIAISGGVALIAVIAILLFATHVICFHDWRDASCLHAKRCTICNRIEGAPLGHDYRDATCVEPKTCKRCGETSGEALGHSVAEWTVDAEATCATEGQMHGTCDTCRSEVSTTIEKLTDHAIDSWTIDKEATCSAEGSRSGTCSICGESRTESIAKKEHDAGDWHTSGTPYISNGSILYTREVVECNTCGALIDSKNNEIELNIEQKNALNAAWSYLDFTSFSYKSLIDQLEFEGYSSDNAKFAADYCGADWYEQAAKKAQDYLDFTSFSRSGLISQLKFEGFTQDQAEYGVNAVGY